MISRVVRLPRRRSKRGLTRILSSSTKSNHSSSNRHNPKHGRKLAVRSDRLSKKNRVASAGFEETGARKERAYHDSTADDTHSSEEKSRFSSC